MNASACHTGLVTTARHKPTEAVVTRSVLDAQAPSQINVLNVKKMRFETPTATVFVKPTGVEIVARTTRAFVIQNAVTAMDHLPQTVIYAYLMLILMT